jgi:hypothetical protein
LVIPGVFDFEVIFFMKKLALSTVVIILLFTSGVIGGNEYRILHDLKDTWKFYSPRDNALLPYIPENKVNTRTLFFFVEPDRFPGESLIISFPAGSSLWINDQLVRQYEKADTIQFPLDSLAMAYYGQGKLSMTLYHPSRPLSGIFTWVGTKIETGFDPLVINPISPRKFNESQNEFIVIGLLIVSFYAMLLNLYPKDSRIFFNIGFVLFSSTTSDDLFKPRSITKIQFLYLLLLSGMTAFLILIFHHNIGIIALDKWLVETPVFISWFVIAISFFLLILLKYLLILTMSNLFNISDKVNYYFFEIIILSMIFYSGLFIILTIIGLGFSYHITTLLSYMVYLVVAFYLFRAAFMFLKIRSKTSVKNLHLFSYLCTTELLPVIIGLKYFLN